MIPLSKNHNYAAIVIGGSTGGIQALETILPCLPVRYPFSVIIVLHIGRHPLTQLIEHFNAICKLPVCEAESELKIQPGVIYFAPPGYHLSIEMNRMFSLSSDEEVNFSKPSVDVLFQSAALAYRNKLIGIVLTGANSDGALGMKRIGQYGGTTVVQDPAEAFAPEMPGAVLQCTGVRYVLKLSGISEFLTTLGHSHSPEQPDTIFPCNGAG